MKTRTDAVPVHVPFFKRKKFLYGVAIFSVICLIGIFSDTTPPPNKQQAQNIILHSPPVAIARTSTQQNTPVQKTTGVSTATVAKASSTVTTTSNNVSVSPSQSPKYGTQTKTSNCTANQALPDPACTPGAILTTDTSVICVSGYTATVRNVSDSVRKKVFAEYGIDYSLRANYEVDHLISLELGGSNDISNLWPEPHDITNGAFVKDKFENYLHAQACKGVITMQQAQYEIATNWVKYYKDGTSSVSAPSDVVIQTTPPKTAIIPPVADTSSDPAVKKSTSGICHAKGTTYYGRTTNYTSYASIQTCIDSGGRLPK